MKVISFNANGIRAAAKKGFFEWLADEKADIVCLQETKAHQTQLQDTLFYPKGYYCIYCDAVKKGYSGVALYARKKPVSITKQLGFSVADTEGRYLQFDYPQFSIASLYLPSGSTEERQALKMVFLEHYLPILHSQTQSARPYILCGDWNIAHQNIDLKNWRSNQRSSGFLPEERSWFSQMLDLGFIDSYRFLYPDTTTYTWWSYRANAWANNVGWRIDYQIISTALGPHLRSAKVYRDTKFSDHAPLIHTYDDEIWS